MSDIKRTVVIRAPEGVHARMAARLAGLVRGARVKVLLHSERGIADISSPAALLQLALAAGDTVLLTAREQAAEPVMNEIAALLEASQNLARRWSGRGIVPGVGSGAPWWPQEYSGGQLPAVQSAHLESDPGWSLARFRVDQQLSLEEQMLYEIGAVDLMELISVERQLLADERLTANLVLPGAVRKTPGAEALADLSQRLQTALRGSAAYPALKQDIILLGYRVLLTHLLGPRSRRIRGIVTCEGGETSHTAIAARWLGIPMVSGLATSDLEEMAVCEYLMVDGREGAVLVRHDREAHKPPRVWVAAKPVDAVAEQRLFANADSSEAARAAIAIGAAGLGLVRSEVLFLGDSLPDEETMFQRVSAILVEADNKPVTIRASAQGIAGTAVGDSSQRGLAAILREKTWFRRQCRAFLRAGVGRRLSLALPLVRTLSEWRQGRTLFLEEKHLLESQLGKDLEMPLGVVLEVPALLWSLDQIISESDFISVGTNDLGALLFAQNRESELLLDARAGLQPVFWRCLASIAQASRNANKPAFVCGVSAGQWPEALLFMGLGFTLSLAVERLQPIARELASWPLEKAQQLVMDVQACVTHSELLQRLDADRIRVKTDI